MTDGLSWGGWLKQRRRACDLTQEQLGELVGCAAETIRRFEGDRLRPSRETAQRLAEQLRFVDGERATFVRAARSRPEPRLAVDAGPMSVAGEQPFEATARDRHALPAPTTPLVGRAQDVAGACVLLHQAGRRLVTLTGTGGTGKTRVALEVARTAAADFRDGVVFVALDALTDPALVGNAIGQALGVLEQGGQLIEAGLTRYLHHKQLLLVLDNFEQVLDAAPLVAALLAAAPELKVLVTSRVPLHLTGEHEYQVLPLPVPDLDRLPAPEALAQVAAIELFVQRVQAVQPGFQLTAANARDVARICCRLDGIPLALILAAAWCKLLRPADLLARLTSSLVFLTAGARDLPARQQTLRATIEWSHRALAPRQQVLFRRMAVFAGGGSLDAVEEVCAADGDLPGGVLTDLQGLLDANLVQRMDAADGTPRVRMLETIREYALEQFTRSGEATTLSRRHAAYFVALAERAEPELRLARYDHWCRVFTREQENIRTVLEWSVRATGRDAVEDVALGVRLAGALGVFWYGTNQHAEGLRWTGHLLARLDEVPARYQPPFLISAGSLALLTELHHARQLFRRALDRARDVGDAIQTAWALSFLGYTSMHEPEAAMPIAEQALAAFYALDHQPGIAQALNSIGEIARVSGDDRRAWQAYEQCLAVCRQTGEARRICMMCFNLSYLAQHAGDYQGAMRLGREGLQLARDRENRNGMMMALVVVAGSIGLEHAPQAEEVRRSAHLLGAAEAARERMGAFLQPGDTPEYDRIVAGVRAQLDDEALQSAWSEGRALTLEQAVAYALA